jgi:hypothetical protein
LLFTAASLAAMSPAEEIETSSLSADEKAFKMQEFNNRLGLKRGGSQVSRDLGPELVVNGGFESGSFQPGWNVSGNSSLVGVTSFAPAVYEGSYAAYLGSISSQENLTQTIATVPGTFYTFSFALRSQMSDTGDNNATAPNNHFEARFGDQQVLVLDNSTGFPYSVRSYAVIATSSTTTIQFVGTRNFQSFWDLDRVEVRAVVIPTE